MEERRKKCTEKAVKQLKACGQEIIKAADKMIGGYDFQYEEVRVIITINPENNAPTITVQQELFPDPALWLKQTDCTEV